MNAIAQDPVMYPWRPLFWEPVSGTSERIMIGVVYRFGSAFRAVRTIRKEVLDCLFGKASMGLISLLDESIKFAQLAADQSNDLQDLPTELLAITFGELRRTNAASALEILETACLIYSSLVKLDALDESDENDAPQQEDVNRRFSSEIKAEVLRLRPDLLAGFGTSAQLIPGGQPVKFGFSSPKAIIHFTVLHPVRHNASLRDARAKIFELQRARELSGIQQAALIAATARLDDPTLGHRQRDQLRLNQREIEREADAVQMRWYSTHSAQDGALKLIQIAG